MRTVTYRLEDLENLRIDIGFVGENEHSKVRIDCLKAFTEYPNAVPAMSVTPPVGESYPAVVERNGDYVEWVVADSDLAVSGSGEAQLSFVQDEVIMKSYKFCTKIHKSIMPTGEVPDPLDDFITRASAALADIPQTIDNALEQAKESGEFKGDKGDPGEDGYTPVKGVDYFDGENGQDGSDGYSPSASVRKSGNTATISVTDKNGTTTATVSDGANGQDGQDGVDGISPTVTVTGITGGHRVVITDAEGDHQFDVMDGQGGGGTVTVDDELSDQSTNPVQNKVITAEVTSLKEAIEDILVSGGESVTLTNIVNIATFLAGLQGSGFVLRSNTDGVVTFGETNDNTEKSPYVLNNVEKGSGVWLVGFKYKVIKNNSSIGDPTSIRIHTGASEYQDDPVVYDQWVSFSKVFTGDLTRIRFSTRGYSTAPTSDAMTAQLKEMYLYDVENVDSEMRAYIATQQTTNYQDGTVTYSTGSGTPAPDTTLNESGKVPDSKVVGDAIKASGNIINVKYYGVKGNGTDDDTDAINDLFEAKTGTFYFPSGTYKISGTIILPEDSAIVGDGDTSIINMETCTNLEECIFRGGEKIYPYILITEDNCAVRHIKLTGSETLYEARHAGIGVLDASRCSIEDVTIFGINYDPEQESTSVAVSGYGICVTRSTFVDVVKCDVRECGYECIGIVDDCDHCSVRDCYTQDGWRTCIQVHRGSCNTLIENNYMKQTHDKYDACFTVHGMTDQKIENLRVVNNTLECTQNGAQTVGYCAPAQIMSHTIAFVFIGNRVFGGKRAFYITDDSDNAKIIGNDFNSNDTSDYGVWIKSLDTIVIGNRMDNEASTPVNQIANNPILIGNIGIS